MRTGWNRVDIMIRSSQDVIRELIDYGVDFAKEDGELVYTREDALQTTEFYSTRTLRGRRLQESF